MGSRTIDCFVVWIKLWPFSNASLTSSSSLHTCLTKHTQTETSDFLNSLPLSVGPNWQHAAIWVTVVATETTQSCKLFLIRRRGRPRERRQLRRRRSLDASNEPNLAVDDSTCVRKWKNQDVNSWEEGRNPLKTLSEPSSVPWQVNYVLSVTHSYTPYIHPPAGGTLIITRPSGSTGPEVDEV